MAELIPLPLNEVQKMRLLARHYEGVLVFSVHHFGLSCKYQNDGFTIAFPISWDCIADHTAIQLIAQIERLIKP